MLYFSHCTVDASGVADGVAKLSYKLTVTVGWARK